MVLTKLSVLLGVIDLAAVSVFAITGALVASRKQMDIVGFLWLAVVTGVGGGTLRDLLLDVPVFWVTDPSPVVASIAAAIVVYFCAHLIAYRYRFLMWLDAVGLALFAIAGTAKGLDSGAAPVVAVAMGVITGVVGGVVRDILGQEPSIVLRREIYVTAAFSGALLYVVLSELGMGRVACASIGFVVAFGVRGFAIAYRWRLPTYRARPGRSYDEI